jgi:hypothetical protein
MQTVATPSNNTDTSPADNFEAAKCVAAIVGGGIRATVYAARVCAASGRVSGGHDTC